LSKLSMRFPAMSRVFAKTAAVTLVLALAATSVQAQSRYRREQRKPAEPAAPTISTDKRDSLVAAPGPYNGKPYWLALAECGGIYFKLNALYTDVAVHARVVKPDPRINAEFSKKITEAIKTATTFYNGSERFLIADRGIDRTDAMITYDGPSRMAADRIKAIDAGETAAQSCPTLYQACRQAFSKQCTEPLPPGS
jgi:hypothetical protein